MAGVSNELTSDVEFVAWKGFEVGRNARRADWPHAAEAYPVTQKTKISAISPKSKVSSISPKSKVSSISPKPKVSSTSPKPKVLPTPWSYAYPSSAFSRVQVVVSTTEEFKKKLEHSGTAAS